jgi:hypothetical protein
MGFQKVLLSAPIGGEVGKPLPEKPLPALEDTIVLTFYSSSLSLSPSLPLSLSLSLHVGGISLYPLLLPQ